MSLEIGKEMSQTFKYSFKTLEFESMDTSEEKEFNQADYAINYILKDFEDNSEVWVSPPTCMLFMVFSLGMVGSLTGTILTYFFSFFFGLTFTFLAILLQLASFRQLLVSSNQEKGVDKAQRYFKLMREVYNTQLLYQNLRVELLYSKDKGTGNHELVMEFHILYHYSQRYINEKNGKIHS